MNRSRIDMHEAMQKDRMDVEEKGGLMSEWGIQSIVDGVPTERIKPCATEIEARDWVTRFPQSYRLVSRTPWSAVLE